jgi:hypothetical protein
MRVVFLHFSDKHGFLGPSRPALVDRLTARQQVEPFSTIEQSATAFRAAVGFFVAVDLLLEFGLRDIDGREHIDGGFGDFDGVVGQVQDGVTGVEFLAAFFGFFQEDFEVGAWAGLLG